MTLYFYLQFPSQSFYKEKRKCHWVMPCDPNVSDGDLSDDNDDDVTDPDHIANHLKVHSEHSDDDQESEEHPSKCRKCKC